MTLNVVLLDSPTVLLIVFTTRFIGSVDPESSFVGLSDGLVEPQSRLDSPMVWLTPRVVLFDSSMVQLTGTSVC